MCYTLHYRWAHNIIYRKLQQLLAMSIIRYFRGFDYLQFHLLYFETQEDATVRFNRNQS